MVQWKGSGYQCSTDPMLESCQPVTCHLLNPGRVVYLQFSFLNCKIGMMLSSLQGSGEDYINKMYVAPRTMFAHSIAHSFISPFMHLINRILGKGVFVINKCKKAFLLQDYNRNIYRGIYLSIHHLAVQASILLSLHVFDSSI